jgi:hypothetical protein
MKKLSRWRNGRGLRGKKRPHQLAVRNTISMPPTVALIAEERMKFRQIDCFSKFVQTLIVEDKNQRRLQLELPL